MTKKNKRFDVFISFMHKNPLVSSYRARVTIEKKKIFKETKAKTQCNDHRGYTCKLMTYLLSCR